MSYTDDQGYCQNYQLCSERKKSVSESLQGISRDVGLPPDLIKDLQQHNVVQLPLTFGDVAFLRQYRLVLEAYDGYKPSCKKSRSLEHWSLYTNYQKWIYEYYIQNKSGDKIYVRDVAQMASSSFGILNNMALHNEIRVIRGIVYNDRRKAKESGVNLDKVASGRLAQLELKHKEDHL